MNPTPDCLFVCFSPLAYLRCKWNHRGCISFMSGTNRPLLCIYIIYSECLLRVASECKLTTCFYYYIHISVCNFISWIPLWAVCLCVVVPIIPAKWPAGMRVIYAGHHTNCFSHRQPLIPAKWTAGVRVWLSYRLSLTPAISHTGQMNGWSENFTLIPAISHNGQWMAGVRVWPSYRQPVWKVPLYLSFQFSSATSLNAYFT